MNFDDRAFVAERAIWKLRPESLGLSKIDRLARIVRNSLEIMDVEVLVTLAFGQPQHGDFNRLNLLRFGAVDKVLTRQIVARLVRTPIADQSQ